MRRIYIFIGFLLNSVLSRFFGVVPDGDIIYPSILLALFSFVALIEWQREREEEAKNNPPTT